MTEREAFVAAVRADPDDDTPRLAFADWLQDRGEDARAEFIRIQCELARKEAEEPAGDPFYLSGYRAAVHRNESVLGAITGEPCRCVLCLRKRERELLDAWGDAEATEQPGVWPLLPHFREVGGSDIEYRRGFVEVVTCSAADWLQLGDDLLKSNPVRRVELTTWPVTGGEYDNGEMTVALDGCDRRLTFRRDVSHADVIYSLLMAEWPGVTFSLPPVSAGRSVGG